MGAWLSGADLSEAQLQEANLSHAQLLEFAVHGCESSPELKNKADALIAQVAPLPCLLYTSDAADE